MGSANNLFYASNIVSSHLQDNHYLTRTDAWYIYYYFGEGNNC